MAIPFATGKSFKISVFQDNDRITFEAKSWKVTREGVMAEDGVCGEDRNRNQFVATGFAINLVLYVKDVKTLVAFMKAQGAEDALTADLDTGVGLTFTPRNGTRAAFVASEATLGGWDLDVSGMSDRAMITLPLKTRYFDQSKAI